MNDLPDPLLFAARALTARGALVEVHEGDAVLVFTRFRETLDEVVAAVERGRRSGALSRRPR